MTSKLIYRITAGTAFALLLCYAPQAAAVDPIYTGLFSSKAVSGYDAVAYFEVGQPVKGSDEHAYEWMGATWRFSNAENLALFKGDPERYAPRYGGYCAYAVSRGSTASADPAAWSIVDGRLYLNYSLDIREQWQEDTEENIRKADEQWPALLAD